MSPEVCTSKCVVNKFYDLGMNKSENQYFYFLEVYHSVHSDIGIKIFFFTKLYHSLNSRFITNKSLLFEYLYPCFFCLRMYVRALIIIGRNGIFPFRKLIPIKAVSWTALFNSSSRKNEFLSLKIKLKLILFRVILVLIY